MRSNITTIKGDTAFLELSGRIEIGLDIERLKTLLGAFASGEYRWAVIDLAGVAYLDARAVDALVEAIERRSGTGVRIVNSTQDMRDLIRLKLTRGIFVEDDRRPKAA